MCEKHVPNVPALLLKHGELRMPEPIYEKTSFSEWKQFGNNWYQGEINLEGKWHGRGVAIFPEQCLQVSTFNKGKMHGHTVIFDHTDKVVLTATFKNGKFEGQVKSLFEDGREEVSVFENGE